MPKLIVDEIAKSQKMSQRQLHLKSGVPWPTTTRYWHNQIKSWDTEVLAKLANTLGVEVRDLIRNGNHAETNEPDETTETTETGEE